MDNVKVPDLKSQLCPVASPRCVSWLSRKTAAESPEMKPHFSPKVSKYLRGAEPLVSVSRLYFATCYYMPPLSSVSV